MSTDTDPHPACNCLLVILAAGDSEAFLRSYLCPAVAAIESSFRSLCGGRAIEGKSAYDIAMDLATSLLEARKTVGTRAFVHAALCDAINLVHRRARHQRVHRDLCARQQANLARE